MIGPQVIRPRAKGDARARTSMCNGLKMGRVYVLGMATHTGLLHRAVVADSYGGQTWRSYESYQISGRRETMGAHVGWFRAPR
jgi:hypothetical protein